MATCPTCHRPATTRDGLVVCQVAGAENEQVIEHLSPAGADEPFADRVRLRGPEGQLHDFDAFRSEDLIEADGELGVAVSEQVGDPSRSESGFHAFVVGRRAA